MLLSDRPSTPELNGDDHHQAYNEDYDDNVNENSSTTNSARGDYPDASQLSQYKTRCVEENH